MCSLITLKSGVIIIGIWDIVIGIMNFIGMIGWSNLMIKYLAFNVATCLALGIACAKTMSIPFAFIGIRGIRRIIPGDVSYYSKFKIFEMFVLIIATLVEAIANDYKWREYLMFYLVYWIIRWIFAGCLVKVVWSADVRLKYNETALVMYGKEALKIMQQQNTNFAFPQVIAPSTPLHISPTFEKL